jgi:hypothetical protein
LALSRSRASLKPAQPAPSTTTLCRPAPEARPRLGGSRRRTSRGTCSCMAALGGSLSAAASDALYPAAVSRPPGQLIGRRPAADAIQDTHSGRSDKRLYIFKQSVYWQRLVSTHVNSIGRVWGTQNRVSASRIYTSRDWSLPLSSPLPRKVISLRGLAMTPSR